MGSKKPIYVFGQSLKKNNKRKIVTAGRIIAVFLIFGLIANTSLASYVPFIAYNKNARVKTPQTLKSPESKQVMPEMTRPEEKYIEVPSTQDVPREGGNQTVNIEPRELVGKRGSHVEEYLNQDGSITRNVYTSQKYYQKDSQWVEIDNTLVEDTDVADSGVIGGAVGRIKSALDSKKSFKTKNNDWIARFARSDDKVGMVRVQLRGETIAFSPVEAKDGVYPQIRTDDQDRQRVLYEELWDGVDVEYIVTNASVKQNVILKNKDSVQNVGFKLDGGTASKIKDRKAFNFKSGKEQFDLSEVNLILNNYGPVTSNVYGQSLEDNELRMWVNAPYIDSLPEDAFPVVIDPYVTPAVYSGTRAGGNYMSFKSDGYICPSTECNPYAGSVLDTDYVWRAWRGAMHFPYNDLQGKTLINANLHLQQRVNAGFWTGTYDPHNFVVFHASCLSSINCIANPNSGWVTMATAGDFNMTELYRQRIAANDYGAWLMVAGNEGCGCSSFKNFDPEGSFVQFTYTNNAPMASPISPAAEEVVATDQPMLKVNPVVHPNGDQVKYYFRVNNGGPAGIDSGWIDTPQWTVPEGSLQDRSTYTWKVYTATFVSNVIRNITDPNWQRTFEVSLRTGTNDPTQTYDTAGPVTVGMATGNVSTSATSHNMTAIGGEIGIGLEYNSPLRSKPGLVGTYYANQSFSGNPAAVRIDTNIDFNWAQSIPVTNAMPSDHFSVRWEGYFAAPTSGTYYFGGSIDDIMTVWIDGIQQFSGGCAQTCFGTAGVSLDEGEVVPIKVEYIEATGPAYARLMVRGAVNEQIVPMEWLRTEPRSIYPSQGLNAQYFADPGDHTIPTDTSTALATRTVSNLSLDWGSGSPIPTGSPDYWTGRITGYLTVPESGVYQFATDANDAARLYVNGQLIVDDWSIGNGANLVWGSNVTLSAGVSVPIQLDYLDEAGVAYAYVHIKKLGGASQLVPSTWLSRSAKVVPDGWSLSMSPGGVMYDFAEIQNSKVTLIDVNGIRHEYKRNGSTFITPENEYGRMSEVSGGKIQLQDSGGSVYLFRADGRLEKVTSSIDVRNPAALKYEYSQTPVRLSKIVDGVDDNRYGELIYSGDSRCPAVPSGLDAVPANMLCAFVTTDGDETHFHYSNERLAKIVLPGENITDIEYDAFGRIVKHRGSLANEVIAAGVRQDDDSVYARISYDELGRASSIKIPAGSVNEMPAEHAYRYKPSSTETTEVGTTEPFGYSSRIEYDSKLRTIKSYEKTGLLTESIWHATKDLILSTVSPTGLMSTIVYDANDLPTDAYGPAPQSWFDANRLPLGQYSDQVPHVRNGFDEGINGFNVAWHDVKTNGANGEFYGAPRLYTTGFHDTNPETTYRDFVASRPIETSSGLQGYGFSATGLITFPTTAAYTIITNFDDATRLTISDTAIYDSWSNRTSGATQMNQTKTFNAIAGVPYKIRFDYMHVDDAGGHGRVDFRIKGSGISTDANGTNQLSDFIKPDYNLKTSTQVFDALLGDATSETDYGPNPEYGLVQSKTNDPDGLSLTETVTYETPGAANSYMRSISATLAGGNTTTFEHYGDTEMVDNPCTPEADPASQAGFPKLVTTQDPDGAGPGQGRTSEVVRDGKGRSVATRMNNDPWTCVEFDTRGRATKTIQPDINGRPGRIIETQYEVGGNPLKTRTIDSVAGTTEVELDLLGRELYRKDVWGYEYTLSYDPYGRLTSKSGPSGTTGYVYDDFDRLVELKINDVIVADVAYDSYSRIESIDYPEIKDANGNTLTLTQVKRDALQRINGSVYETSDGKTFDETVLLSQSGRVYGATQTFDNQNLSSTYSYDGIGRLTSATVGETQFDYGYGSPDTACSSIANNNTNAHKNSNRTSSTITNVTTSQVISAATSCFDIADRLISSGDAQIGVPTYDDHGNTVSLAGGGTPITFSYNAGDHNIAIEQGDNKVEYTKTASGLVLRKKEYRNSTLDKSYRYVAAGSILQECDLQNNNDCETLDVYQTLPGGITQSIKGLQNTAVENRLPDADAGVHQLVEDTDDNGSEDIDLSALGSSDDDGTVAGYVWKEGSTTIGSTAEITTSATVGTHTYELTITDNNGGQDSDTVIVTVVEPGTAPTSSTLLVRAAGNIGDEIIGVEIDGVEIDNFTPNANQQVAWNPSWSDHTFTVSGSLAPSQVRLTYNNDANTPQGSRDIRVDYIEINGTRYEAEGPDVVQSGGWGNGSQCDTGQYEIDFLACNGYFQFAGSASGGSSTPNRLPNADAGANQFTSSATAVTVQLDGSSSSDPDGTISSYVWKESGTQIATGATPTVSLAPGTHTIVLEVTDDDSGTSTDQMIVQIAEPVSQGSGDTTLLIRAAGNIGDEIIGIEIDGVEVDSFVPNGNLQLAWNPDWSDYTYTHSGTLAAGQVRLTYKNDASTPQGSRDIRVDYIEIDGVRYETEAPDVIQSGGWGNGSQCSTGNYEIDNLACNGYFQYSGTSAHGGGSSGGGGTPAVVTYSIANFHGDTALTLNAEGVATSGLLAYGPFGEQLITGTAGSGAPDNASDLPMGWAANPNRKQEQLFSIPIVQMGSRVYLPTLGRFLQMDPVLGGNLNAYIYAHDPINGNDYSGNFLIFAIPVAAVIKIAAVAVAAVVAYNVVKQPAVQEAIGVAIDKIGGAISTGVGAVTSAVKSHTQSKPTTGTQAKAQAQPREQKRDDTTCTNCGVYKFIDSGSTNPANAGKVYIGKTIDFEQRKSQHGDRITPGTWNPMPIDNPTARRIRIAEQLEINKQLAMFGGHPFNVKSGLLANKINSISEKNFQDITQEEVEMLMFK